MFWYGCVNKKIWFDCLVFIDYQVLKSLIWFDCLI